MKINQITRFKAFSIHFGISFAIFLVLLGLILFDWYPFPLFDIEGGWRGIGIILGVDLVLGPMLTLMVFRPGKPGLKLDMSLIALVQFVALTMGVFVVYDQRPVLMVFADDRFYTFTEEFIPHTGLTLKDIDRFAQSKPPPLAIVKLPEDEDERTLQKWGSLGVGGVKMRGDLYEVFDETNRQDMLAHSMDITHLTMNNQDADRRVKDFFSMNKLSADEVVFFPLHGRFKAVLLGVNKLTGDFIDTLDIEPRDVDSEKFKVKISKPVKQDKNE